MTKKYHDTEYLYLSACIHSWETRLLTPERREQLLSAPTDRDAARVLEEMGWPAFDPESEAALDQAVGRRRMSDPVPMGRWVRLLHASTLV